MEAMLIDLDGVIYQEGKALPGAADTLRWITESGLPHLFLTNTTSRPRSGIVERLAGMGLHCVSERILTPPVAARAWLAANAPGPVALFVPEVTREDFHGLEVLPDAAERGAAAVVLGDLGERWDFRTLNRAFRLLMQKPAPQLVALGMTRYWRAADGLRLDTGPFVAALREATAIQPVILGKPARPFFETALRALAARPERSVMIGDDIRGDVGGAQKAGLRGVLVRTGKFQPSDLSADIRPDAVLDDIGALPGWWAKQEGRPGPPDRGVGAGR